MARDTSQETDHQQSEESRTRLWSGMISFAAFMMLMVGGFHVVGGFVALFEEDQYQVGSTDLLVSVDYNAWGIAHMALGVGMMLAASALFFRKTWGRVVAVVLASVGAITNLAFLSAAPLWYALMIGIDVLIIYAVTVHPDSEPEYDY
ncbi:MAG: DUF7144 family membrane protein [Nocardioides sp.]